MGDETKVEKLDRKTYERELGALQVELCHLQDWVKAEGARCRGLRRSRRREKIHASHNLAD